MSLKTFFETIFVTQNTIKNILELYPNVSEKGFKFERCADLLIKLIKLKSGKHIVQIYLYSIKFL